jgi:D-3-phosphoglycerate dehydrogenase
MGRFGGNNVDVENRELKKAGIDAEVVSGRYSMTEAEFLAIGTDADIVLGGGRLLSPGVMKTLAKLRAIITYSVGFDGVDVAAATAAGIVVVNNPAANWCLEEVSNHAIALLLDCAKRTALLNDLTKHGRWAETRRLTLDLPPINGQTLGLVGCGAIARMMARKAQAFGLVTVGFDPYLTQAMLEGSGITLLDDIKDLLARSDFVSLHAPLSKDTSHMMGDDEFRLMKPTAFLINTARGGIVDEAALVRALQEKRIAGAGLDVFEKEPIDPANPLLALDNVVVTPHSAAYSTASVAAMGVNPSQEAARVLSGKWPRGALNRATVKPRFNLQ